ncbi:MAG: hypothetical protein HKO12_10835 [Woeseiaceae bacterium]|nr:hypothetical protein [Woeseiaceae bacterium]
MDQNYSDCPSITGFIDMFPTIHPKISDFCAGVKVGMLASLLAALPAVSSAEIIWSGDFATGDFTQWHHYDGPPPIQDIRFQHMEPYGRPIQYGSQNPLHVGNGDFLSLVASTERTVDGVYFPQGPIRGQEYSAKFTVKSRAGGGVEPDDCDRGLCNRRRTALSMQATHSDYYNAIPNHATRWLSFSVYLPSDYIAGSSGYGGPRFGLKPKNEAGGSGNTDAIAIVLDGTAGWKLWNRWIDEFPLIPLTDHPWQHGMFYTGNEGGGPYPRSDSWPEGLVHFPDVATSHAALQSVNLGGWTDWVVQLNSDSRGAASGGRGFLKIWKREDNGPWIFVLDVFPGQMSRGGMNFDHGIGYDVRATSNNGGYGVKLQLYMAKEQVWNDAHNKVVYFANVKVGDQNTEFSDMSPDGSSPDSIPQTVRPLPPSFVAGE